MVCVQKTADTYYFFTPSARFENITIGAFFVHRNQNCTVAKHQFVLDFASSQTPVW